MVREKRVGGSSTRFPLSLVGEGGFWCVAGVVTTSRDVDWSGRCARLESRRPKKRSRINTRRRPTRKTNQSKTIKEKLLDFVC